MHDEPANTPSDKSTLEKIAPILAAVAAVFSVLLQWKQNPWLAITLVAVAVLLAALAYAGPVLRSYRAARLQSRRDKFALAQFPEVIQFVKGFAKFADSGDGRNIRNMIFYGCGNDQSEVDRLCPPDYLKEIFPHFFARLKHSHCRNEAEFCVAVKEFYTLAASYNNNYVLEPFRRMNSRLWLQPSLPPNLVSQLVGEQKQEQPKLGRWLTSLPEQHRENLEKQIEDFRERWVGYLDDLTTFLEKLRDTLGSGKIDTYFERPKKL